VTTRENKTPDWLVERLAHGELDATAAAQLRARLEAEGRAPDAEITALLRADRETLEAQPPGAIAAEIRRRAAQRPAPARRPLYTFGAVFAAGAAALVLVARQPAVTPPAAPTPLEPTRWKGTPIPNGAQLYVYRHAGDGDRRLPDGARAARGDLLQLAYATADGGYGVLVSIDGGGAVTQHWPEPGGARAVPLRSGGEVRLPSSYELDDAPAFERFFFVRAGESFDVAPVVAAARALAARAPEARRAPLPLPDRFAQTSFLLEKTR
jgi:hypothetical protein